MKDDSRVILNPHQAWGQFFTVSHFADIQNMNNIAGSGCLFEFFLLKEGVSLKIVISGFYGLGNTGDEAILEAIIVNLREQITNPQIMVFSLSPEKTAKEHNVKSLYRGWRHDLQEKIRCAAQSGFVNQRRRRFAAGYLPDPLFVRPSSLLFINCLSGQALRHEGDVFLARHRSGQFKMGKNINEGICQYGRLRDGP